VTVTRKEARLADGTLAGSVLSLDRALRNLINFTGCSPADALRTVTTTPAALLGLSQRKGQIAPGFDADLVLATPDFTVIATIVAGQVAYRSESLLTNGQ
jgi:N-acetylglucosamine-6-phosphate deacetylase